ncbi:Ger(x)C family spore germination protein [Brevibacillus centrosporus]|uniref:Germination protein, Ger(X)C family n=1 Tax=Brevibacillus centrosporus TaxID=54910 RepID=A0A1I3ZUL5_9BACL|nr:Ger(x)C family spore germination protein [Brevibacillus centrosporus]MED4908522.1 Ger(x)C family spore germination protein [Brevibacillus centrosporus]SFK47627.1 germination protein, Ger(x)C family [Brevibacillus centrosporus]
MRSKWITSVLLTCLLTLLSGCWDQKSIQDMIYLSAFGIDFVDNEYVIYAQSSDLASVAKQEGAATGVSPPAVVSIGRGETLQNALDNLQKNSQVPMFAGFISSIIYHERLLKRNILPSYDFLNRYGLVRYTKWVFGTREPLQDVLSNHALTGFSPLISLLHQPEEVYKQRSFIEPIQYFKFIERFWNPSSTIALPNITIYERSWKENNKFVSRLSVDGIHAIHRGKWEGFFPNTDLLGLRWMNPHTEFAGVIIRENGKPKATLRIKNVRLDVHPVQKGVKPTFHVHIYMKAFVREVMGEISNEKIKRIAEKEVIEQVRGTFLKGVERGVDLFGFEETLYKRDVEAWKQFAKNHENKISAEALDGVTVHLYLSDSGKMKQNWFYPDDLLPK